MACFIAPVAEAIVVSAIRHSCKKKEEKRALLSENGVQLEEKENGQLTTSQKLGWLTNLLWGGSFLLAIEHMWHGEIVPWAPFLTAMNTPGAIRPMLLEIATTGVLMALLVSAVWATMVFVSNSIEKKTAAARSSEGAEQGSPCA